jgi:hypothetical protein
MSIPGSPEKSMERNLLFGLLTACKSALLSQEPVTNQKEKILKKALLTCKIDNRKNH